MQGAGLSFPAGCLLCCGQVRGLILLNAAGPITVCRHAACRTCLLPGALFMGAFFLAFFTHLRLDTVGISCIKCGNLVPRHLPKALLNVANQSKGQKNSRCG
jgi:hypothetical protein